MKRWNLSLRGLVVPALALATVATLVTGAHADRGNRYRGSQRDTRSSYRAPGGFTVQRGYVGGTSSYRAPGGFTVNRGYVGGSSGSYRGPGGFVVHRQVIAPRAYYGGGYGYYRGPRVHFGLHYSSYPAYPVYPAYPAYPPAPMFGLYLVQRPVSGGFLCGPVGGGASFSITLGNVLPSGDYYYDPYCGERFSSLSAYYDHCQGRHEARVEVCDRDHGPSSYRGGDDRDDDDGYYQDDGNRDDGYYDRDGDDDDDDDGGGWQQR